ncbi:MAG: isopenicillin N synthase family oxygenase [Phenylobacterium sp.]|uniref:isopenicillin N synthase family dioxygenase n=1 Tax=Phenylobacterium sp. TaxID=1871053 RepID=UPI0025D53697|nr:2-oxoglutarate and iron-dependent oxygenase domain-containing protein [Phenylobacterium sp.]MCA3711610.1 isopenicillin N synthase family oxygenase [Phenylobacterium sp.]MCA3723025.1 isopenicillin N synthase family oxygenase [Phenylobacterium sp.]MCA6242054.1 isopenicillin N synthase family oxygenase [Phenylobacterium sp.]MCA6272702.1 isopenicillin N synthase family oxygenase [Phenylobacterium sp.]MCA6321828.1 isopenicillin N synthase family oxygenase [Phenylobacterium sp.]
MSRTVPELRLSDFTGSDPAARARFQDDLFASLRRWGFVILTDHNVPTDLLDRAYQLSADLFQQPEAVKLRGVGNLRGYAPFGKEHARGSQTPDLKEFWQIGREPTREALAVEPLPENVWPQGLPGFRETFSALYAGLDETGRLLLSALAPSLDLAGDWFESRVRYGPSVLRLLHYPPVPADAPAGAVRSAAHEDINLLTILVAARGAGLQLLDRDGSWVAVETEPGKLIVDSGDMLARLTNGVIPATTHRVVNPDGPNVSRYSMPFFLHPHSDLSLAALPSCRQARTPEPEITAGAFLAQRLREIGLA